jgi:hypothetical protein
MTKLQKSQIRGAVQALPQAPAGAVANERLVSNPNATRMKLKDGEVRDEVAQNLYDTINFAVGQNPIGIHSFFSSVQGKPSSATNLRQNNMLESAVSFRVTGMSLEGMSEDFVNWRVLPLIMKASGIRFRIGEKEYFQCPAYMVGGRFDVAFERTHNVATADTAASLLVYQRYGASAASSIVFGGKHALDIAPLQSFRVDMEVSSNATYGLSTTHVVDAAGTAELTAATPATNPVALMFVLKGLQRRPVQ